VRYADDCNIHVHSERGGQRVMAGISDFITRKLKLKVNRETSAVDRPSRRQFLGFSFAGSVRLGLGVFGGCGASRSVAVGRGNASRGDDLDRGRPRTGRLTPARGHQEQDDA